MIKYSKLIVTILLTFFSLVSFAIKPDSTRRLSVSLGVYLVNSEEFSYGYTSEGNLIEIPDPLPTAVANIKINYQVLNNFEVGGYLAYSNMGHKVPLVENSEGMYVLVDSEGVTRISSNRNNELLGSNTLFYGLSAKYDLLPVLTGKNNLRFNLYVSSKLGLVSARWSEFSGVDWVKNWNGPFMEYGIGLGAGYFFTKRFGINFNYTKGKFYNNDNSRHYLGLVYKI